MSETVQLFAVEADSIRPLPIPDDVTGFDQLYDGLELGVYSALRSFEQNKFLYLAHHIQRTRESAAILGWDETFDEERLRHALHEICTHYPLPQARVRFDYLATPASHLGSNSRLLIGLMPFTPPTPAMYRNGVRVELAPELTRQHPLAKTADFAQARRAYKTGGEIYEYLLLNEQKEILEGTGTNFYGVHDGVFRTAGQGILAGITRKIILDLADELNIPVSLKPVKLAEVPLLTEAALSGSSRGLLPVNQIGDQVIGNGRPGPICQKIAAAYNNFVAHTVKTAV